MQAVPMLKGKSLDKRMTMGIDGSTLSELQKLKSDHRVDISEWIRGLIRAELPKLKAKIGA